MQSRQYAVTTADLKLMDSLDCPVCLSTSILYAVQRYRARLVHNHKYFPLQQFPCPFKLEYNFSSTERFHESERLPCVFGYSEKDMASHYCFGIICGPSQLGASRPELPKSTLVQTCVSGWGLAIASFSNQPLIFLSAWMPSSLTMLWHKIVGMRSAKVFGEFWTLPRELILHTLGDSFRCAQCRLRSV